MSWYSSLFLSVSLVFMWFTLAFLCNLCSVHGPYCLLHSVSCVWSLCFWFWWIFDSRCMFLHSWSWPCITLRLLFWWPFLGPIFLYLVLVVCRLYLLFLRWVSLLHFCCIILLVLAFVIALHFCCCITMVCAYHQWPVVFQQTRVPNSLPMGANYVDYEPQGTEVIQVCLQTTP